MTYMMELLYVQNQKNKKVKQLELNIQQLPSKKEKEKRKNTSSLAGICQLLTGH